MAEILAEDKGKALDFLESKSDDFRWAIKDPPLTKRALISEVRQESDLGAIIVNAAKEFGTPLETNVLGKRYICLVCNIEVLVTKGSDGRVECCGQLMDVKAPRPLPGSD